MTTINNKTAVTVPMNIISSTLAEDKHSMSKKSSTNMVGMMNFNSIETSFTVSNTYMEKTKSYYSAEEIEEKIKDFTVVERSETEDEYLLNCFDITINGVDVKMLLSVGVLIDFSLIISEFKRLQAENKIVVMELWMENRKTNYNNSFFIQNLEFFRKNIPAGVDVVVKPTLAEYIDYSVKTGSTIKYEFTYSYSGKEKTHTLEANYTSSGKWSSHEHFSGYALKESYNHLGLFKTNTGIIARIKKEYDLFKEKIEVVEERKNQLSDESAKIQKMFGKNIEQIISREYDGQGRNRSSHDIVHFEGVFNLTSKKAKYGGGVDYFGTGIQFITDDKKSFRITDIKGEFASNGDYLEFVEMMIMNKISKEIKVNPMAHSITEAGMKKIIQFVSFKMRAVEISAYSYKSIKSNN